MKPTLLWFRQDLRLEDNPALKAAREAGRPIVAVYVLDDESEGEWPMGGASRWWLHHALRSLDQSLRDRGSRLNLLRGRSDEVIARLSQSLGVAAVYWNRRYEPAAIARDSSLKAQLSAAGIEVKSFNASLLFEPHTIQNKQGKPFQVFTPFWKHCLSLPIAPVVRSEKGELGSSPAVAGALPLEALELLPTIPWDSGFSAQWSPGEAGARARLKGFVASAMQRYADDRNRPDLDGTSQLSPWLHFGEIGPRQVWAGVAALSQDSGVFPPSNGARVFLSEVGWREFAYHLLFHFPHTPTEPLRSEFSSFPWADDPQGRLFKAWRKGQTGYPIVDAGMRQLWETGWMHNRVRMIVASFLVKHLRLPWQLGSRWFWDTLVDADLASNTLGWQWTAGCGADAAPYFRIFAPVLQGQKFDPDGSYVRRWVPELAKADTGWIHCPWLAPSGERARAGIALGRTYPEPMVDHGEARTAALDALKSMRKDAQ